MHDPHTDPKSISAKYYLFKVCRMLQHIQRNFDLYQVPAWNLSIDEQTIGFKSIHKDKIRITFKYVGDVFQDNDVCYCDCIYSFIYRNNDIPDLKHYLCASSERVIWILKYLRIEWNRVYMDNLYNKRKLFKAECAEKKLLHGGDRTHG